YPSEIDLQEFLDPSSDRSQSWKYILTGVIVHSGDLSGGQYYVLMKPDRKNPWLKFNDDRVTRVTDQEGFEKNYGGPPNGATPSKRFTKAYMLVYVRESLMDEVLTLSKEDIPLHLSIILPHLYLNTSKPDT